MKWRFCLVLLVASFLSDKWFRILDRCTILRSWRWSPWSTEFLASEVSLSFADAFLGVGHLRCNSERLRHPRSTPAYNYYIWIFWIKRVLPNVWWCQFGGPTLDSSCQVLRWHDRERQRERHIAGPTSVGMKVPPVTQGNQRNHCVISVASNLDMLWAHAVIRLSYWCYIVDTGRERTCLRGMTFCLTEPNAWCMNHFESQGSQFSTQE